MGGFNDRLNNALDEAVREVVADAMTDLARERGHWRRLPRLSWCLNVFSPLADAPLDGLVGAEHPQAKVPSIVRAWADALGLVEAENPGSGLVEYAGTVDGRVVRVWGVVDRGVWETSAGGSQLSEGVDRG